MNKKLFLLFLLLCLSFQNLVMGKNNPKREFRGAWLPTVTGNYMGMSETEMKSRFIKELDALADAGVNAVLFQVRPEADAWYKSSHEPWSRFITGVQGKNPGWDPTKFIIEQCHRRGMEFHAWINPYRVKTNNSISLASNHIYNKKPDWFIEYGGQTFFNPALQESRNYICRVVKDLLRHYDVDAIHLDDYFYPYPKAGEAFDDDFYFKVYGKGYRDKGDWRRHNVNMLIEQLHKTIIETKPWVQLGISPFGIYRNKKNWSNGSRTNGLQNYDDLYADVLLWAEKGWIDYLIPQIYWEIGHNAADYKELVNWWAETVGDKCALYIGQDVLRTVRAADIKDPSRNQLDAKMNIQRSRPEIDGMCFWPGKEVVENSGNFTSDMKLKFMANPALPPVIDRLQISYPKKVRHLKTVWTQDGYILFWSAPKCHDELLETVKYCIYRFNKDEKVDLEDASKLVEITSQTYYMLPYIDGKNQYKYVVTAVNRFNSESKAKTKRIKL